MSAYGKLVVKIEVLDPSVTGDEENVFTLDGILAGYL